MTAPDLSQAVWRTSSFSTTASNCVEVAFVPHAVALRDSKHTGPTLTVPTASWQAFLSTR